MRRTKGTVWQYTTIDVASASTWASLHVTHRNPSAHRTSALARRVAADLAERAAAGAGDERQRPRVPLCDLQQEVLGKAKLWHENP